MTAKFFERPKKEETLAEKAEKRNRKIIFKRRLAGFSPQWLVGTGEVIGLFVIFAINFFLLLPFFGQPDQTNVFSAPFIPVLAQLSSSFMPYDYGVRFWLLVFILIFPLSYYFFIREVSKRRLISFISVLFSSLPITVFLSLRAKLGLLTEDGGQVASLTLTMMVCLFLLRFLKGGSFKMGIFSSLGITLVALTSPLGAFVFLCFALALTFSEMLLSQGRLKLARFLAVFALAAGFSAFWYNPKFIFSISASIQGQLIRQTLANLFPLSFFLAPLLGAFGFLLFENRPQLQPLFLAVFWSIGFGLLSLGAGVQLSTPSRFLPSLGISLAFFLGILLTRLYDFLQKPPDLKGLKILDRYRPAISSLVISLFLILLLVILNISGRNFREAQETQVLGMAVVKRTGIWEMKEESGGIANVFGVGISLLTFGLALFMGVRLRKK